MVEPDRWKVREDLIVLSEDLGESDEDENRRIVFFFFFLVVGSSVSLSMFSVEFNVVRVGISFEVSEG